MLVYWYFVLLALLRLIISFIRARWHLRFKLMRDINLDGKELFSEKELSRVQHYFLGTSYLSTVFCCLIGRRRSSKELYLFSNLSALASFFDDLVDIRSKQSIAPNEKPEDPVSFGRLMDHRGLSQQLLNKTLHKLPSGNLSDFKVCMERVYAAEMDLKFSSDNLVINNIIKNTMEKGANSVLLFRFILEPRPGREERQAILEFGSLVQLSDDIFDVWFDQRAGAVTAATFYVANGNLDALVQLFEAQIARTQQAFQEIPISKWRIKGALSLVYFLIAITRVCLRRYQEAGARHGAMPILDRKKMVVDMSGLANQLLAARLLFFNRSERI